MRCYAGGLVNGASAQITLGRVIGAQQRRTGGVLHSSTSSSNATAAKTTLTDGERNIANKLSEALKPASLDVKDISGGCGAMYAISVASEQFRGLSLIKQHRMVVAAIDGEIKVTNVVYNVHHMHVSITLLLSCSRPMAFRLKPRFLDVFYLIKSYTYRTHSNDTRTEDGPRRRVVDSDSSNTHSINTEPNRFSIFCKSIVQSMVVHP
jgi:stress-induced morphogen